MSVPLVYLLFFKQRRVAKDFGSSAEGILSTKPTLFLSLRVAIDYGVIGRK